MKCIAQKSANIYYRGASGYDALIKVRKGSIWQCRIIDRFVHIIHGFVNLEIDDDTFIAIFKITPKEIEENK